MTHALVIGCGYSGARVAAAHLARGDDVTAVTRSSPEIQGVRHLQLDIDATRIPALPQVDRVYYTVPPPASGVNDPRLARVLAALPPPRIFAYFSTTGVYGHCGGALVDETASLKPGTDRARRRVDAERQVNEWCAQRNVALAILRIAGIYGPRRLPLDRLRAGEPVPDPADTGPGNRIHVDDLANAAVAIADSDGRGTWNVSDGNPMSVADFNDVVADAAVLPRARRVPLDSPEISPGLRSFLRESRQIDNRKLLSLTDFTLRYADPSQGIRESLTIRPVTDEEDGR
ncbi:MAG TPA: NAD-dependent epimerase/dehydratase family protein [Gammaproteobacteria bacterium]